MMTATDTPPDTDTKAAAVAWLRGEYAAGRDPETKDIAARYSVSERSARNYRSAARGDAPEPPTAPVVPIRGNASGNGAAPGPRSVPRSAPAPEPVPATPPPVAAATVPEALPESPRHAATPVPASGKVPERQAPALPPVPRPAAPAPERPGAPEPRQPEPDPAAGTSARWWDRALVVGGLTLVRFIAAAVSYGHMRHLAYEAGQDGTLGFATVADVLPLTVDGLAVLALVTRRLRRRQGLPDDQATALALYLAIGVSLAANVASSWGTVLSVLVGAWAPIVLFVAEAVEKPTGTPNRARTAPEEATR